MITDLISIQTEIFHHLVILVLQHVTVPHVTATPRLKPEVRPVVMTELYPQNCHRIRNRIQHVPEHFFVLSWLYYRAVHVGSWIQFLSVGFVASFSGLSTI